VTRMKRPSVRIDGVRAGSRCGNAAKAIIRARLCAVERYYPLAVSRHDEDDEYVHQLRVWTRRSAAAIRTFQPWLAAREAKRIRRLLRRLRQSAAPARDCDVHLKLFRRILETCDDTERSAVQFVIRVLEEQRADAQLALRETAAKLTPKMLRRSRRRALASVRKSRSAEVRDEAGTKHRIRTLRQLARTSLPPLATAIRETAGRQDLSRIDRLHEVRICAKRLRYAYESLAPGAGNKTRAAMRDELLPLLEQLGNFNDDVNIIARLEAIARLDRADEPEVTAGLVSLIATFGARCEANVALADEAVRTFLKGRLLSHLADRTGNTRKRAPVPHEIESRLVIASDDPSDVASRVRAAPSPPDYQVTDTGAVRIEDRYYEVTGTNAEPTGALPRWGGTLRLRTQDGSLLITLKGPPSAIDVAGGSTRTEIELPWSAGALTDVLDSLRDEGIIGDHVRTTDATDPDTALRACGFVPLIASTTDRSTFAVRNSQPNDQPIGEIAVDRVAFDIAGRTLRLHVVEVEATGNGTADVVRDVTHALTESFGTTLRPWPANKVRTALLLRSMITADDLPRDCLTDDGTLLVTGVDRLQRVLDSLEPCEAGRPD